MTDYYAGQILYKGPAMFAEFYMVLSITEQWIIVVALDKPDQRLALDVRDLVNFKEADEEAKRSFVTNYRIVRMNLEDARKKFDVERDKARYYDMARLKLKIQPHEVERG